MSKLTFRADEALIQRIEALDASKSEIMRAALRDYLSDQFDDDLNPASREQVLEEVNLPQPPDRAPERVPDLDGERDVNITITLDGIADAVTANRRDRQEGSGSGSSLSPDQSGEKTQCGQCGERVLPEQVYCPNCGSKTAQRVFCECGGELRSDWAYCPGCGRRTPAADVLDDS